MLCDQRLYPRLAFRRAPSAWRTPSPAPAVFSEAAHTAGAALHRQSADLLRPPRSGRCLVYLHNLWFGQQSAINPVAWTLEVEVQFYCLAPALAVVFRIRSRVARRATLAGIVLLAGIVQTLYWDGPARVRLTILYAIQFFLTGFLLAYICVVD